VTVKAILTYHSIDPSGSVISLPADRFAAHVRWLASGSVTVLAVTDLLRFEGEEPAVAITFDDAFENFATSAWPLLRDHGLPVTMFVPTGFVGGTNAWQPLSAAPMASTRLLDWPALGRLAEEGVELGMHTRTHPDLRSLGEAAITDEIAGSAADIERHTGRRPFGLAYPYGFVDERVLACARATSRWACTTALAPITPAADSHLLPRVDAYYLRGPARVTAFGTVSFRAYLRVRAGLRALRVE
jgi:peptidoglycan/xylan/chitin deacetylase (PgdA/CDA1 family)